jgi:1,4-alpha-glucan branching enzyme
MLEKRYIKSRKVAKVKFVMPKDQLVEGVEAHSVHLVGDFNNWDVEATPMKQRKKDGAFYVTLDLEPGQRYEFRYLVNGEQWCNDWHADAYVPSDTGEDNCVVVTPDATSVA